MRFASVSVVAAALAVCVYSAELAGTGGSTTRGWSCCKNSCSWSGKALVSQPVLTCDATDNILDNFARRDGCESGGGSYTCSDLSPWAVSNELAYGFAGVNLARSNESAWCCSCYKLTFVSGAVTGKSMVVQVTNTGSDLGSDQFDLYIPGGGQGDTRGCSKQYGSDVWGAEYGGVSHREDCDGLPEQLQGGCYWRFDWFRNTDNPAVDWEKVQCPSQLTDVSGCKRNDESGVKPSPTTSSPIASGTVQPGGQCGGKSYKGPTRCVAGTVCTFVDENSYYCIADPGSTRTTPTTTSTPSARPTAALPWDQCGGRDYTGPKNCINDSVCVTVDEWYSQCQPRSLTSKQPTTQAPQPTTRRTRRTRPGNTQPTTNAQPTTARTTSRAPVPTGPSQQFDQCGGATWEGSTRCVEGLKCVKIDEWYSQCQKPE